MGSRYCWATASKLHDPVLNPGLEIVGGTKDIWIDFAFTLTTRRLQHQTEIGFTVRC